MPVTQAASAPAWPQAAAPPANRSSENALPSASPSRRRQRGVDRELEREPPDAAAHEQASEPGRLRRHAERQRRTEPDGQRQRRRRRAAAGRRLDDDRPAAGRRRGRRRAAAARGGRRQRRQQLHLHGHRERQAGGDLARSRASRRQLPRSPTQFPSASVHGSVRRSRRPCARSARRPAGPPSAGTDRSEAGARRWRGTRPRPGSRSASGATSYSSATNVGGAACAHRFRTAGADQPARARARDHRSNCWARHSSAIVAWAPRPDS